MIALAALVVLVAGMAGAVEIMAGWQLEKINVSSPMKYGICRATG